MPLNRRHATIRRAAPPCRRAGILALVLLAIGTPAAAKPPPVPATCAGRFILTDGRGPLLGGVQSPVAPDLLVLEGAGASFTLGIGSGCAPAAAVLKQTKKGITVGAHWKRCGTARKVRLAAMLDASCDHVAGTFRFKGARPRAFEARRSACGDGTVDAAAGEACEHDADCPAGNGCQRCACVAHEPFRPENAYGSAADPLPPGAVAVTPAQFEQLVVAGGLEIRKADRDQAIADQRARSQADHALVDAAVAQYPELGTLVNIAPDAGQTPVGGGDLLTEIPTADGPEHVVLHGVEMAYHGLAASLRGTHERPNQERLYAALTETLPGDARDGLPDPSALVSLGDDEVRALVATAAERAADVLPNVGPPEAAGVARAVTRAAGCAPSPTSILAEMSWPLKNYTTPVRWQGKRGTCVAHGIAAALEAHLGRASGMTGRDLSEQELYAFAKGRWFPVADDFGDGLDIADTMSRMVTDGFRLHGESEWAYDPSAKRTEFEEALTGVHRYDSSCVDYDQACSETNHQFGLQCVYFGGYQFCLDVSQVTLNHAVAPEYVTVGGFVSVWEPSNPPLSVVMVRALLAAGIPVVMGVEADLLLTVLDSTHPYLENEGSGVYDGTHAVFVTGWAGNDALAQRGVAIPPAHGGGYFIVKNSWGCNWGDDGYAYLSADWMALHAFSAHAITGAGTGGTPPGITLVASAGNVTNANPTVTLTATTTGAVNHVDFYEGFTKINKVTSPPFSTVVSFAGTTDAETHYYYALGFDAANAQVTSNVVEVKVNVDPLPPTVSLAVDGQTTTTVVAGTPFTLTATATDNVGVTNVEFYETGRFFHPTLLGNDTTAPYQGVLTLGLGAPTTHAYVATAYDAAGNKKKSNPVIVTVIAAGQKPIIASFTATPTVLPPGGGQVTLAWSVLGAASLSIDQGVGPVSGSSTNVNVTQPTLFTLTATNASGSTTAQAYVSLQLPPPSTTTTSVPASTSTSTSVSTTTSTTSSTSISTTSTTSVPIDTTSTTLGPPPPGPRYVDALHGSDANPGTEALPMKTLRQGIATAGEDGVLVADGVYDATTEGIALPIDVPADVNVQAINPGHVTVDGLTFRATPSSSAVIGGFVFDHGSSVTVGSTATVGPVYLELDDVEFRSGATWASTLLVQATGHVSMMNATFDGPLRSGTITVAGTGNLSIQGGVVDGGGAGASGVGASLITLTDSAHLYLDGVTIRNSAMSALGISGASAAKQATATLANGTLVDHVGSAGNCAAGAAVVLTQNADFGLSGGSQITNSPSAAVCIRNGKGTNVYFTIDGSTLSNNAAGIASEPGGSSEVPYGVVNNATLTANAGAAIDWTGSGEMDVTNSTVSGNGTGIHFAGAGSFDGLVLANRVVDNADYGVRIEDQGSTNVYYLGHTGSPGGNTFTGNGTAGISATLPAGALVHARGNTWNPSVQGADGTGAYAPAITITGPASGKNYVLVDASQLEL